MLAECLLSCNKMKTGNENFYTRISKLLGTINVFDWRVFESERIKTIFSFV